TVAPGACRMSAAVSTASPANRSRETTVAKPVGSSGIDGSGGGDFFPSTTTFSTGTGAAGGDEGAGAGGGVGAGGEAGGCAAAGDGLPAGPFSDRGPSADCALAHTGAHASTRAARTGQRELPVLPAPIQPRVPHRAKGPSWRNEAARAREPMRPSH